MYRNQVVAVVDSLEEVHYFEPVVASLDFGNGRLLFYWKVFTFGDVHELQTRNVQMVHHVVLFQVLSHFFDESD